MRRLIVLSLLTLACAKPQPPVTPPPRAIEGRWVAEVAVPMAYHFWGDSVELVMYPPQAPAPPSWRLHNDSVVVDDGTSVSSHRFYIRGDSLFIDWNPGPRPNKMVRVPGTSGSGITGTWRTRTQRDLMIVTFRSDGALVGELGAQPWTLRRGDTLLTRIGQGTLRQVVLRGGGGAIHLQTLDNPQVAQLRLVRRAWGCFGRREIDRDAPECR